MAIDDNTSYGLTGAQVKELPEKVTGKIDARIKTNAGAPTTSTVGTVGQLLEDTINGDLYICTAIDNTDPQNKVYTWTEVGSGGGGGEPITLLTKDDYNYPENNPYQVSLSRLPSGIYRIDSNNPPNAVRAYDESLRSLDTRGYAVVIRYYGDTYTGVYVFNPTGMIFCDTTNGSNWREQLLNDISPIDNLTSSSASSALSANQGKVLNGKIEGRIKAGSGAPTTATVGTVGILYEDAMNGNLYQCTGVILGNPTTYTWREVANIEQLNLRQKKPVTVWEVDGTTVTTGLVGVNEDISANPNWQLTNLDLTPYKRIKIFSKAAQKSGTTASASTTPAIILEMSLDPRAAIAEYGGNYVASNVVQKPNDSNRLCTLCCAVSADKTKFEVLRMTNLYGTAATSNSDVNAYVFKIEGYYD